jgi:hypothetical protein
MAARGAPSCWRWTLKPAPMSMFRACCWRRAKDIRAMLASDVSGARYRFKAIGSTEVMQKFHSAEFPAHWRDTKNGLMSVLLWHKQFAVIVK